MLFHSKASSSAGNLYTVSDGKTRILLECGLPFPKLQKALNFELSDYAACLVTHEHKDHCKAAAELLKRGIAVWCPAATAAALGIEAEARAVIPGQMFHVDSLAVLPFECKHDAPCVGYLIHSAETRETLVYATDTMYLPNRFAGLTEIAVECNHSRESLLACDLDEGTKQRIMENHMSLDTFIGFLQANDLSRVEKIWLLHMSDARGDAEGFRRAIQEETGIPTEVC